MRVQRNLKPDRAGAEHVVVMRGRPTDAELAAVVTALACHGRRATAPTSPAAGSRWIRAVRLEGSGHPPIDSPMRLPRTGWGG